MRKKKMMMMMKVQVVGKHSKDGVYEMSTRERKKEWAKPGLPMEGQHHATPYGGKINKKRKRK